MKKIILSKQSFRKRLFLKVLCLFVFFMSPLMSGANADTLHKDVKLNIHVENKNALHIFKLIKEQTAFNFVYNDGCRRFVW